MEPKGVRDQFIYRQNPVPTDIKALPLYLHGELEKLALYLNEMFITYEPNIEIGLGQPESLFTVDMVPATVDNYGFILESIHADFLDVEFDAIAGTITLGGDVGDSYDLNVKTFFHLNVAGLAFNQTMELHLNVDGTDFLLGSQYMPGVQQENVLFSANRLMRLPGGSVLSMNLRTSSSGGDVVITTGQFVLNVIDVFKNAPGAM